MVSPTNKHMVRPWMRQEISKLIDSLDGQHDMAIVAGIAVLGHEGFDFGACEQSDNLDPAEYGPAMLEGLCMIAGAALAQTINVVHAAHQSEQHFTQDIEDPKERLQEMRNQYEQAVREFIKSAIRYAGGQFQEGKESTMSVAAGSQLLNLWMKIAGSTIKFHTTPGEDDGNEREEAE